MKLGLFIPNWVGDAVMCTPALRALRTHYGPQAQITAIMRPYVADVLAGSSWFDDVVYYHPRSKDESQRTRPVVRQLRARKFDAILMFTNSLRSAAMAWLAGAPERIGYVRYARGPLLTHKLYAPRKKRAWLPIPAIDAYLQLAYAAGCRWESPRMELATLPADEAAADAAWSRLRLDDSEGVVVLNSGGAYGSAKVWPSEYFAELARRIASQLGLSVLVNCGPAEQEMAHEITAAANHPRVVSLADEPISIGLSKACIRRARLLVTTDSGPRFFAAAFGLPIVSLFGPTDERWSRTHYERELGLQHAVPCGPCGKRTCPLAHHDCMRLLTVDRVYAAAKGQLAQHRAIHIASAQCETAA